MTNLVNEAMEMRTKGRILLSDEPASVLDQKITSDAAGKSSEV